MTRHRAPLLALAALAACTRTPPPRDPEPAPEPASTAPIRGAAGDVLDVTVPLLDGRGVALQDLRGRVVVLELTSAADPAWRETFAFYNRLVREHGPARLAVFVVAVDPERAALSPEPDLRADGFELGWDPQGALAARLQAIALPTVVVLDRAGRIAHVQGGPAAGATRSLEDSVRAALAD
jgi:peroxiredoxin